jgi:large subunit ribosomal protein L17
MRHGNSGRNFGRTSSHRKMMGRMLATALFTHGRIRTTVPKAKELAGQAADLITLAKRGDLHARRQAEAVLLNESVTKRLFDTVAGWYKDRQGGYTRILLLENRPGDNAPMAYIELVDRKPLGPIKVVVHNKKKFKNKGVKKDKSAAKPAAAPKAAKAPAAAKKAAAPKPAAAKKAAPAKKVVKKKGTK